MVNLVYPPASNLKNPKVGLRNPFTVRCQVSDLRSDCRKGDTEDAEDVIDLGAPRFLRRTQIEQSSGVRFGSPKPKGPYEPSPRLYPGPQAKSKPKPKLKKNNTEGRGRRHKRRFTKPVPNARLYRPVPPKPPSPPGRPNTSWPPPPPLRSLDQTASRVALQLSEQRRATRERACVQKPQSVSSPIRHPSPIRIPSPPRFQSKRLVVKLPSTPQQEIISGLCYAEEKPIRYRPTSAHFRLQSLDTDSGESTPVAGRANFEVPTPEAHVKAIMEAANRHSTSPEDCSDGNEPTSAPSEFLAEFLSAIMRRQYAEALKYCRLILQYEPNNATARGFYPLLRQKLETQKKTTEIAEPERGSSSEESHNDASGKKVERRRLSEKRVPTTTSEPQESMEQEDDTPSEECVQSRSRTQSEGSCASQSSLELDSSDAVANSSPSLSFSRRTEQTDSASGSGAWCVSAGSAGSESRSDPDDNGNQTTTFNYQPGDVENDNAAATGESHSGAHLKNETSSLQRLRAQFACSIK